MLRYANDLDSLDPPHRMTKPNGVNLLSKCIHSLLPKSQKRGGKMAKIITQLRHSRINWCQMRKLHLRFQMIKINWVIWVIFRFFFSRLIFHLPCLFVRRVSSLSYIPTHLCGLSICRWASFGQLEVFASKPDLNNALFFSLEKKHQCLTLAKTKWHLEGTI